MSRCRMRRAKGSAKIRAQRGATPQRSLESGDTLVEVLIAVVIIAIAASALLGALVTSISGSRSQRSLAVDDAVLKSFAEATKAQVELQSSSLYAPCAST